MMKQPLILLTVLLAGIPLHAQVLYDLNDTVLAGNAGANTFIVSNDSEGSGAGLSYSGTEPELVYTLGSQNSQYTYFVAYFDAFTLTNVGESITLNYSLTPSSTAAFRDVDDTFRLGLFNSNGERMTANNTTAGDSALSDDTGYVARYRPRAGTVGTGNSFYQRTSTSNNLWTSGSYASVSGAPTLDSPGTGAITGSFRLTLVSTGIELTSVINGNTSQSVIDTAGLETTFDSLSIFTTPSGNPANPTLTFDTLSVSVVPEPATAVSLLGGLGVLWLAASRRRRESRVTLPDQD